jgi:hypothetical protein
MYGEEALIENPSSQHLFCQPRYEPQAPRIRNKSTPLREIPKARKDFGKVSEKILRM